MCGTFEEPPTGLIPWFSKTEGNTYATIARSPFPLQGKPTQAQDVAVPFVIGMLLARDSIIGIIIPSSISLPASLFTCSVMHHPVTNSLVTFLARLIVMCIIERAQRYLSDNRSDKS